MSEYKELTAGQQWNALRKEWKRYKIAKVQHDKKQMNEHAKKIRELQALLTVPQTNFPEARIP